MRKPDSRTFDSNCRNGRFHKLTAMDGSWKAESVSRGLSMDLVGVELPSHTIPSLWPMLGLSGQSRVDSLGARLEKALVQGDSNPGLS